MENVSSKNVFGGEEFESLQGVPCPYCQEIAKPGGFSWPMVKFNKAETYEKLVQKYPTLKKLGKIEDISPLKQSNHGNFSRITMVKLTGANGQSDSLRGEDLRLTVDPSGRKFKSTICEIENFPNSWAFFGGRGWGHGVGMCQCGAQALARRAETMKQILYYYYPNSKIRTLY